MQTRTTHFSVTRPCSCMPELQTRRRTRKSKMDKTEESVGIRVYNSSPQQHLDPSANNAGGRKRRAMAKGVQNTISKTSMLVNFLPTGTLLTYEMVIPSIYHDGECSSVTTMMIYFLLTLCSLSCFFFHFTDSFRGPDGKLYFGIVTPNGLSVFKPGLDVQVPKDERYKAGVTDFVHAFLSVLVFVAIAFSDFRVTNCVFPGREKDMHEMMESFPLMVGIICSTLFLVFPNSRSGIGCMAA